MMKDIESSVKLTPKEFMKARRPERFSDSITKEEGRLDRVMLEFQLSILNRKSMELAFENFSKQLCEKTICPNLLEQTGPVAGGDGKVDTQTFPVSEQTSVLWYVGINKGSNSERWAFAVSTRKDWKVKCKEDVKKINGTDRGYTKAFCITNQHAKSNQRSDLEDVLTKETGMDIRILDASWICDQVFNNGYEKLAIDALSLDVEFRREIEYGTNDYERNKRIKELRVDIKKNVNAGNILPHQVGWFLEEAILSKELEKPQIDTRGCFDRAVNVAKRHATEYQMFDAHYSYAWAAYWWFEDLKLFESEICSCFELAKELDRSGQWGDVIALMTVYRSHFRVHGGDPQLDIDSLMSEATDILEKMSLRDYHPSNSLMARFYIELMNLLKIDKVDDASGIFNSILMIVNEGNLLIGFPFYKIYNLIEELDKIFYTLDSYEKLLDYLTELASEREGETNGSLLWLKRGARRLESGEPYQAIKLVGKSLVGLNKEEMKKNLFVALNILSSAYRKVGLCWASRANLLRAASMVTDDYWKSGELEATQAESYLSLAKSELQLGRINYALAWWKLACTISSNVEEAVVSKNELYSFDGFLSQCILNTNFENIKKLENFPDILKHHHLMFSRSMLLYVLGHEDLVKEEYNKDIDEEYLDFLKLVRDVYLGAKAAEILVSEGRYSSLKSSIMGCEITVSFPFRSPVVELSETILAVLEGFCSTGIVENIMVIESIVNIEITVDDDDEINVSHEFDDSGANLNIEIICSSFDSNRLNISGQGVIQSWLNEFVFEFFARVFRPKDLERTLHSMLCDDKAMDRSISFGMCFIGLQNILGDDAVNHIKDIHLKSDVKPYKAIRNESWDKDFLRLKEDIQPLENYKAAEDEAPTGILDGEKLTHEDVLVQNLIKVRLWNRAKWGGTGYSQYPNGTVEMALLFENKDQAITVFDDLLKEIGSEDSSNRLRVTIVRHIDKNSPAHYRVCVGENSGIGEKKILQMKSRINTMIPPDSKNLDQFLAGYERNNSYLLSYDVIKNKQLIPLSSRRKYIRMFELNVIDAWQVGPNDLEVMAIQIEDDPIIPEGIENPPIYKTLKSKFK